MSIFGKVHWAVFDCLTGDCTQVARLPFEIGSDEGVDLRLDGAGVAPKHCALAKVPGHALGLVRRDEQAAVLLNGNGVNFQELTPDTDYSLLLGEHLLLLRGSKHLEAWQAGLDHTRWSLFNPASQEPEGPLPLLELCGTARREGRDPMAVAVPSGSGMGFYLGQVLTALSAQLQDLLPLHGELTDVGQLPGGLPAHAHRGALTCPVCWLRFDAGDVMHVAVHDSLRGDPVLGQDAPLRFSATQFNERGQALDAFDLPCTDIACPHCRRGLPPGFLEAPHHILSIVGDQSAGKSYYLSVLIRALPIALYREFGVVFQDADPAGNALLNDMKKTLFSARTPAEARLVKTQLEGAMYERLPRYGRIVALPKPFVFYLYATAHPERRCSVIFYDNAGEHFQPGRDSADSPGAQHVVSSSGILFLFDPFNNPELRQRMAGQPDPQLEKPVLDQQDIILSELKVRVKRLLNLDLGEPIRQPLAFLVGKCDAWMHLLGEKPFLNPVARGRLDLAAVRHNSDQVRRLLLETAPTAVANAEGISRDVMYFPVSAFGHPPVKIGAGDYVPDPRKLKPMLVEVPALWLLSRTVPELVAAD
jgi:hypothetical protein